MPRDTEKVRAKKKRYLERKKIAKYGPQSAGVDMRGRHGNSPRGERNARWRGGNPKPDPAKRRANAEASMKKYPDRRHARVEVQKACRRGDIPYPKELPCSDCGRPANSYDHPRGYDTAHIMDVEAVCYTCHGLRSGARGEHRVPHYGAMKIRPGQQGDIPEELWALKQIPEVPS